MVGEALLADRLPEMLRRIQFRAVGRKEEQPHVCRHHQGASEVPARLIHDHQNELIGVSPADFGEEERHGFRAHPRKDEAVEHAVMWADSAERVEVLALQSRADDGAHSLWCPTAPRRAQQAETPLVLEHHAQAATEASLTPGLATHLTAEFF